MITETKMTIEQLRAKLTHQLARLNDESILSSLIFDDGFEEDEIKQEIEDCVFGEFDLVDKYLAENELEADDFEHINEFRDIQHEMVETIVETALEIAA